VPSRPRVPPRFPPISRQPPSSGADTCRVNCGRGRVAPGVEFCRCSVGLWVACGSGHTQGSFSSNSASPVGNVVAGVGGPGILWASYGYLRGIVELSGVLWVSFMFEMMCFLLLLPTLSVSFPPGVTTDDSGKCPTLNPVALRLDLYTLPESLCRFVNIPSAWRNRGLLWQLPDAESCCLAVGITIHPYPRPCDLSL